MLMVMPFVFMAILNSATQAIVDNKAFRGFVGNMSEKAIEEIENKIDDLVEEPLAEEVEEMLKAFDKAVAGDDLTKALEETSERIDLESIEKIIDLGEMLRNFKISN